jgi:hypothetical protein
MTVGDFVTLMARSRSGLMDDMLVELKDPDLAYLPEKLPAFGA